MSRGRGGFAVTTTMVAVALFGMLLTIALSILLFGQRRSVSGNAEADLQQEALALVYRLTQEVGEAREILLPLGSLRSHPFLALRTLDQEVVLYVYEKSKARVVRQIVDPQTWQPSEERVVCADVASAGFRVPDRGRMVRFEMLLAKQLGDHREELPIITGIGVRGW